MKIFRRHSFIHETIVNPRGLLTATYLPMSIKLGYELYEL